MTPRCPRTAALLPMHRTAVRLHAPVVVLCAGEQVQGAWLHIYMLLCMPATLNA